MFTNGGPERETLFTHVISKGSPSSVCEPKRYKSFQDSATPLRDGRSGKKEPVATPPIEVVHPAFAAFCAAATSTSLVPDRDILEPTIAFMADSAIIEAREEARIHRTRALLTALLSSGAGKPSNINSTSADHSVLYHCSTAPFGVAALAIVEEKAEMGQNGDPSTQGVFSYVHHWGDSGQKVSITSRWNAPINRNLAGSLGGMLLPVIYHRALWSMAGRSWRHCEYRHCGSASLRLCLAGASTHSG